MVLSGNTFLPSCCYFAVKSNIMKKTALRYGLYGVYLLVAFCLVRYIMNPHPTNFDNQETIGWIGILLSVFFVFFGIKYYRDKENGGSLGFGEGMKLGLLITIFPALLFGIYSVIYSEILDPGFMDNYYNWQVAKLKSELPPAEFDGQLKEMEQQKEMFVNPLFQFGAMFLSVFVVGLIVTVISTLVLKRKARQVAMA